MMRSELAATIPLREQQPGYARSEKELWGANFASRLMEVQPRSPLRIARQVAESSYALVGILHDAVETLLVSAMHRRGPEQQHGNLGDLEPPSLP